VDEATHTLDSAITGVAKTLEDNDDNDIKELHPTVPHDDVTNAPTMATMMLLIHTMQSTNQAILNCLDAMDDNNKKNHGRLHVAINLKADSSEIARLDH
jgi:hypothetical protein